MAGEAEAERAESMLIEPSTFDLIVLGTGLPQCIVAAAAASAGQSVLHLDPAHFYGSYWASLPLLDFQHWATTSNGLLPLPTTIPQAEESRLKAIAESGLEAVKVAFDRSYFSDFSAYGAEESLLGPSRGYSIDLAGPKMAFCAGPMVELLLRSGGSNYVEFRGIEGSYMWTPSGLSAVPSSRADVFQDRSLTPMEKRYLMRFFKLVTDSAASNTQPELSDEVLDAPFIDLLRQQQLPPAIQAMILYTIALADADQDQISEAPCGKLIKARDGLHSLALYLSSVGRFPNVNGAFLYPLYGQGELPQVFSRCAAVKGALQVLRMSVDALVYDKESLEYKGVLTTSGQLLFSKKLVTGPLELSIDTVSNKCTSKSHSVMQTRGQGHYSEDSSTEQSHEVSYIARGICITDKSLQNGQSTIMVVFPPKSTSKYTGVIRALQLGSNASVSPEGKFIVQFSTMCSDKLMGIESLQLASRTLFHYEDSSTKNDNLADSNSRSKLSYTGNKPILLFSAFYVQQAYSPQVPEPWDFGGQIAMFGLPDGKMDYRATITSAEEVFHDLFPGQDFFPSV